MSEADDAGRSSLRSRPATFTNQRATIWSGAPNRWEYHPGEVIPAP